MRKYTCSCVILVLFARAVCPAEPIEIGTRRELFVDDYLIARIAGGAELRLHQPIPREVVLVHDEPWEGTASSSHVVFRDGEIYRMYYRGWNFWFANGMLHFSKAVVCYAESKDGIHWTKPELGLVEFQKSKKNNIVHNGIGTLNFSPFIDTAPVCPPERRYKAIAGVLSEGGVHVFQSADGLRWSLMHDQPVLTKGPFDSVNVAFFNPVEGRYRAYLRTVKEGRRAIRTTTSRDLVHWEPEADLAYMDSPKEEMYENKVFPYPRAPHILIGLPARYIERGWSPSMRALPDPEQRAARAALSERFGTALTETQLMASRDGVHFKRWNEAFIRPGIERAGTWQYGHQFAAWQFVETASSLPGAPPELSFYTQERYWEGGGVALRRYTLRLDGFVSARANRQGGDLLTRPLVFQGRQLELNFSTSAAGSIRVEIQNEAGQPLEGFALAECPEIFGDTLERVVAWKRGTDLSRLAGKPVRLRFELKDADLYAFRFANAVASP